MQENSNSKKIEELLEKWRVRVKRHQLAHRFAAKGYGALHIRMGVPAVALSTLVGAFVFASFNSQFEGSVNIAVGLASVSAAILTALQTFLRFDELSNKHQAADSGFGAIRHNIEQRQALYSYSEDHFSDFFEGLESKMEKVANESPLVPERFWLKARKELAKEPTGN